MFRIFDKGKGLRAFSLPEMLVVLVIIGILVLIALPNLMPLISKAKAMEAQQQLAFVHTLQKSYFYTYSRYSDSLEEIGFEQQPLVTEEGNAYKKGKLTLTGKGTQSLAQNNIIETLKDAFSQKDWQTLADSFPETFEGFLKLYGYDAIEGEPMPLYDEGYDHIFFLFSDDRIRGDHYMSKLLRLTKGYEWDADAPNYLHENVGILIENYPSLISVFMEDKPDILVKDFLKCAIASPYPGPKHSQNYNSYLSTIELYEEYSSKIVRLLREAHQELMREWED